jgi:hypothetical protein
VLRLPSSASRMEGNARSVLEWALYLVFNPKPAKPEPKRLGTQLLLRAKSVPTEQVNHYGRMLRIARLPGPLRLKASSGERRLRDEEGVDGLYGNTFASR